MNKKFTIATLFMFVSLGGIFTFQYLRFNDGKLHLVFCDVGQGDGILIRTPTGKNIMIDSGADDKIINCIENHTPFWDRTISLAILTHPHLDHFFGYNYVFKKYKVDYFATEKLNNNSKSFENLLNLAKRQNIKVNYVYAGDKFNTLDKTSLTVVGPTKEYLSETSPNGQVGEKAEFASLIILTSYGDFNALTSGDSQAEGIVRAISDYSLLKLDILQIPHHGSKTGLNSQILQDLNPQFAVISAGKKNKYGHPAPFILDLLKSAGITTLRTDREGSVEFVSDGENFYRTN